jgi:hypothetical protein
MQAAGLRRAALAALAAIVAFASLPEEAPQPAADAASAASARQAGRSARPAPPPAMPGFDIGRLDRLGRRTRSAQAPADLFALDAPAVAAAAQQAAASPPPPPPQAPELPFRYLGSQEAGGSRQLFFERQQETYIVQVGDTIGNAWRLDSADGRVAVFTYVPLGQQKTLALGGPG